jgi:hypothetical protein
LEARFNIGMLLRSSDEKTSFAPAAVAIKSPTAGANVQSTGLWQSK